MPRLDPDVAVLGTGSAQPERRITNAELRPYVKNYDESSGDFAAWVDRVTHIQERRWIDPERESAGSLGLAASRRALEAARMRPEDVDHVIFCSFTMNEMFPGDHVHLVHELGLSVGVFAVSAACAGSVWGVSLARSLVQSGQYRNVLVVGAECVSRATDLNDPLTAILFADAAGAVVVGRKSDGEDTGFYGTSVLRSEFAADAITMWNGNSPTPAHLLGEHRDLVEMEQERPVLKMSAGPSVLRNAVNRMASAVVECLGFTMQDLKDDLPALRETLARVHVVPHQANGRIVDGLQQKLGLPAENVYRTIYFLGNASAATTVFTLDYAVRNGNLRREPPPEGGGGMGVISPCGRPLRKGDLVVLVSIGAGYLYGAVAFVHAY
jgi:3-oxoacyl-[acyl-carrier-protein] synthase III